MLLRSKKALAPVMVIGVVIAMATLLVGGAGIFTKLLEGYARASPAFVSTSLVSLINTVDAAPESATFYYYTELDANGFPVIGSLEIDDDASRLCIHKKTEDEMMSEITEQVMIAAGFGGTGYAYNKYRSAVAKKAAMKALRAQNIEEALVAKVYVRLKNGQSVTKTFAEHLSDTAKSVVGKDMGKQLTAKAAESSYEGLLIRKFLAEGEKALSKKEVRDLNRVLSRIAKETGGYGLKDKMNKLRTKLIEAIKSSAGTLSQQEVKDTLINAGGKASFWERWKFGASSWWQERRISKYTSRINAALGKLGAGKAVKYIRGKIQKYPRVWTGVKTAALVGGIVAAQYYLSEGDWTQTVTTAFQFTLMAFAPKLMQKLIMEKSFEFLSKKLAFRNPINRAFEALKNLLSKIQFPPGVGTASCFGVHAGEIAVNLIWSVWDTYTFDYFLYKVYSAGSDNAREEKEGLVCKTFKPSGVLLTPPNCQPKTKLAPPFDNLAYRVGLPAGYFSAATAFTASIPFAIAGTSCMPGATDASHYALTALEATGIGLAGVTTAVVVEALSKNPTAIIPQSGCDTSCDREYLRQDCPNWYISTSRSAGSWVQQTAIIGLLQAGPGCSILSFSGWASFSCNAARVLAAVGTFFISPDTFFHYLLNGDGVGLTKEVGRKSALGMTDEFADNKGFWYAELPYAIEITKIYTDDGSSNLVIRKI